jgi:hypothetical protein
MGQSHLGVGKPMTRALVLAFLAGALVLAKVHRDARRWRTEWDADPLETDDIDWLVEYRTPSYSLN